MAKAYKCDICEQLYDEYHNLYLGKTKTSPARLNNGSSMYYDICPDCVAAIQKTIENRQVWNVYKKEHINTNTKGDTV